MLQYSSHISSTSLQCANEGVFLLTSQLQHLKNQTNGYNKPHLTFEEQIHKLKNNGLTISNDSFAIKKLSHTNYYRLSAYFLPFQYPKNSSQANKFFDNVEFRQIVSLYDFDAKLRRLIFGALEVIEVYVRTQIAYHHSLKYGAFGYLEHKNFQCDDVTFEEFMEDIKKESKRSDEIFVKHFRERYNATDLPLWSVVEVLSFGTISKLFYAMHNDDKKSVCTQIPVSTTAFGKWLHAFTIVRNICAHHSRIWNKELRVAFAIPSKNSLFDPLRKITKSKYKEEIAGKLIYETREFDNNSSVFFTLSVIKYFFDSIGEEVDFTNELKALINEHPSVDLKAMGFVDGWESLDIWSDV